MKNTIDMNPYLPNPSFAATKSRRAFWCLSDILEAVVTLAIGGGFCIFLAAFFGAL